MDDFHFLFVDTNEAIVAAWKEVFAGIPNVEAIHGSVFDHPADVLVSQIEGGYPR